MSEQPKLKECKTMFSNGTEYEWFIENNCDSCTRFRNWQCSIIHALENARFDETCFPYDKLLDYADECAGKVCKEHTTEPIKRHRRNVKGQLSMKLDF